MSHLYLVDFFLKELGLDDLGKNESQSSSHIDLNFQSDFIYSFPNKIKNGIRFVTQNTALKYLMFNNKIIRFLSFKSEIFFKPQTFMT